MLLTDVVRDFGGSFDQAIAEQIWKQKYRYVSAGEVVDQSVEDTFRRVARGVPSGQCYFATSTGPSGPPQKIPN